MQIRYEGPAPFAALVAQQLEAEGVPVTYTPRVEARSAQSAAEAVVVFMSLKVIDGLTDHMIDAAIKRVRESLGERLKNVKLCRED